MFIIHLLPPQIIVAYDDNLMLVLSFYAVCFIAAPNAVPEIQ